jgi:hypothetical protein
MAAKKKPIEETEGTTVTVASRISGMSLPPARPEGRRLEGDAAAQASALLGLLKNDAKVL